MLPSHGFCLPTCFEAFQSIFADGLEHDQTRLCTLLFGLLQQTFVDERCHCFQHVIHLIHFGE